MEQKRPHQTRKKWSTSPSMNTPLQSRGRFSDPPHISAFAKACQDFPWIAKVCAWLEEVRLLQHGMALRMRKIKHRRWVKREGDRDGIPRSPRTGVLRCMDTSL